MNTYKTIRLRQYIVQAVDRRTGERITDTVAYERGASLLLGTYDTDLTDAINRQYSRKGFQVTNITKGKCCTCRVELGGLFHAAMEEEQHEG
ncbi:MAG: hypothetical protein LUE11_06015 [Clostridia bacterium]|nr:hypothetical protein [Clostridia bacterium]